MTSEPTRSVSTSNKMKGAALAFLLLAGCLIASITIFGPVRADGLHWHDSQLYQIR